ncbi:MAG: M14 family metallopeptidase [Alphaproteobacteria bacterium]|nr:M14 family metallopeptidase [Alphaproteobacteria bacterium]
MTHSVERIPLKSPSPGTERFLTVHRFGERDARPKTYLQAALHADEWPGLMALNHLIPMLAEADAAGRITGEIVVLPYANPIGLSQRIGGAAAGRYAQDGSGNFNRNWPDLSAGAASYLNGALSGDAERDVPAMRAALLKAVGDLSTRTDTAHWRAQLLSLSIDADHVIDIHCDNESLAHLYCHRRHADQGVALAAYSDIPIVLLEEEAGGFSFDDCNAGVWRRMGDLVENGNSLPMACFGCTLELRGKDDISDELGHSDATGLYNFLIAQGAISGDAPEMPDAPEPYRLEEVDTVTALESGLLAYKADVGEMVREGQVLAELIDISAADPTKGRTVLRSETDGIFFARVDLRLVEAGERIGKVAGRKPLASRQQGALLED